MRNAFNLGSVTVLRRIGEEWRPDFALCPPGSNVAIATRGVFPCALRFFFAAFFFGAGFGARAFFFGVFFAKDFFGLDLLFLLFFLLAIVAVYHLSVICCTLRTQYFSSGKQTLFARIGARRISPQTIRLWHFLKTTRW